MSQAWPPLERPQEGPHFLAAHVLRVVALHNGFLALQDLPGAWRATFGFPLDLAWYGCHSTSQLLEAVRPDVSLVRYNGIDYLRQEQQAAPTYQTWAQAAKPPQLDPLPQVPAPHMPTPPVLQAQQLVQPAPPMVLPNAPAALAMGTAASHSAAQHPAPAAQGWPAARGAPAMPAAALSGASGPAPGPPSGMAGAAHTAHCAAAAPMSHTGQPSHAAQPAGAAVPAAPPGAPDTAAAQGQAAVHAATATPTPVAGPAPPAAPALLLTAPVVGASAVPAGPANGSAAGTQAARRPLAAANSSQQTGASPGRAPPAAAAQAPAKAKQAASPGQHAAVPAAEQGQAAPGPAPAPQLSKAERRKQAKEQRKAQAQRELERWEKQQERDKEQREWQQQQQQQRNAQPGTLISGQQDTARAADQAPYAPLPGSQWAHLVECTARYCSNQLQPSGVLLDDSQHEAQRVRLARHLGVQKEQLNFELLQQTMWGLVQQHLAMRAGGQQRASMRVLALVEAVKRKLLEGICNSDQELSRVMNFWCNDTVATLLLHVLQLSVNGLQPTFEDAGSSAVTGTHPDAAAARRAAAVPGIVSGIHQLKAAFARSTNAWSPQHVKALKDDVTAFMAAQGGSMSGQDALDKLHTVLSFMVGKPVARPPEVVDLTRDEGQEAAADHAAASSQPAGRRLSPERLRAVVLETAQDEGCGSSVLALAGLEAAVLRQYKASSWTQLSGGSSGSLLQLLGADAGLMEAVCGGAEAGVRVPLEEVLQVAAQAQMCSSSSVEGMDLDEEAAGAAKQAQVAACLCRTFNVQRAEQLGHGPIAHILRLCFEHQVAASRSVLAASALAPDTHPVQQTGSGAVGAVDSAAAIQCLQAASDLTDLDEWSQWQQVFAPALGPLKQFLQTEGERHGVMAVEVPGGRLLKLRANASTQEFVECCSRGDAHGMVCCAVSLAVQSSGVNHAPLALIGTHVQACLRAMAMEGTATSGGEVMATSSGAAPAASAAGTSRAAGFVLRCLVLLPAPLAASLAPQLLLEPLSRVLGGAAAAHASLLEAAGSARRDSPARSVLHRLGWSLGITYWQEDWRRARLAPAVPKEQQVTGGGAAAHPGAPSVAAETQDGVAVDGQQGLSEVLMRLAGGPAGATADTPMEVADPAACGTEQPAVVGSIPDDNSCRALIEAIRRDEFGVGVVQPNQEAAQLHQRQVARVGRALTRLSRELYSVDTHFVLELVQNADDNTYPPNSFLPATLEFVLQPGCISVLNNEAGFSASDVRALCDVGVSTKTQGSGGGYIGQKGIGFKSVFKVTDAPQVHSNGFHVKFDLTLDQSLGYVLPTWVDEGDRSLADAAAASSRIGLTSASTRIVLPLKHTLMEADGGRSLRQRFGDVHPTLLLFLQRLQCIAITDAVDGVRSTVMVRRQLEHGLVELRHGPAAEHTARWLLEECTMKPSLLRLGKPLAATKVALGFCLEGAVPSQQQAFAFLPLRSYGLRFVVQGDFVVPSSREALDSDSAWNQMLRVEIPVLFSRALASFMRLPAPAEGGRWWWVDRWLRCVPLEGEAQGFFAVLPHSIAAVLRAMPCILADDDTLVAPGDAMYCANPTIRQLVSGQQLQALLGKRFVHPDVEVLASSAQLRSLLGVREFSPGDTLDLLKAMIDKDHGTEDLQAHGVRWVQQLLLAVFDMLDSKGSAAQLQGHKRAQVLQQMRTLQLLPLEGGGWASAAVPEPAAAAEAASGSDAASSAAAPLFFPLPQPQQVPASPLPAPGGGSTGPAASPATASNSSSSSVLAATATTMRTLARAGFDPAWLRAGPQALRFLSAGLLEGLEADDAGRLVRGLQLLGVRELSAADVARYHVLRAMARPDAWQRPKEWLVASLLVFVAGGLLQPGCEVEQGTEEHDLLQALKPVAVVVGCDGKCYRPAQPGSEPVLLPAALGGAADWHRDFPTCEWRVLAESYASVPPALLPAWKWLLGELGLQSLPPVVHSSRVEAVVQGRLPEPWHSLPEGTLRGDPGAKWTIEDHSCPALEQLAAKLMYGEGSGTARMTQRMIELLDGHWDIFGPAMTATCTPAAPQAAPAEPAASTSSSMGPAAGADGGADGATCSIPSTLAMSLRRLRLPTAAPGELLRAASLFYDSSSNRALLGSGVPYLKAGVARPEVAAALGVVCEPDFRAVLSALQGWSRAALAGADSASGRAAHSPKHMAGVYRFLSEACVGDEAALAALQSAFVAEPLVWLPSRCSARSPQAAINPRRHWLRQQQERGVPHETCEAAMQGRFVALSRLCLQDPTGLMEQLPEEQAPLRVVLAPYPSLSLLFERQLACRTAPASGSSSIAQGGALFGGVRAVPSEQDYVKALQLLSQRPGATKDSATWGGALPVLLMWAQQLARGQLTQQRVEALAAQLRDAQVLRAFNGGHWVSLGQQPYLCDDHMLQQLLGGQPGVHLLVLPDDASLSAMLQPQLPQQQEAAQAAAGEADASPGADLGALLGPMGVLPLSLAVEREVRMSGGAAYAHEGLLVADALPHIQRFLLATWPPELYAAREGAILSLLEAFTCQTTQTLHVVYSVPVAGGPPAASAPTPRVAVLNGSTLLLCGTATSDPLEDMSFELCRLFNGGAEDQALSDFIYMLLLAISSGAALEPVMARFGVPPASDDEDLLVTWQVDKAAMVEQLRRQEQAAMARAEAAGPSGAAMGIEDEGEAGPSQGPNAFAGQKRARQDGEDDALEGALEEHDGEGEEGQLELLQDWAAGERPSKRQRASTGALPTQLVPHRAPAIMRAAAGAAAAGAVSQLWRGGAAFGWQRAGAAGTRAGTGPYQTKRQRMWQRLARQVPGPHVPDGPLTEHDIALLERLLQQSTADTRDELRRAAALGQVSVGLVPASVLREAYESLGGDGGEGEQADRAQRPNEMTGLWGERVAFGYLRELLQGRARVDWVNQASETGMPFDITIAPLPAGALQYVEVKATMWFTKMQFEVSQRELAFAQQNGGQFSLLRVFGARGARAAGEVAVMRLHDPVKLWRQHALSVVMVV